MLQGARCIWLTPGTTQLVPREECLRCARSGRNPCGYPLPVIKQILTDRDPTVVQCSATMIAGCARESGLKKNTQWWIDPREAYIRAHGSLLHLGAEVKTGDEEGVLTEDRIKETFTLQDGRVITVTAQLDIAHLDDHDGDVHCHIVDYKSVDSLAPSKLAKKVESYRGQLSIQRWLMASKRYFVDTVSLIFLEHRDRRVVQYYLPDYCDFPENEPNAEFPAAVLMTFEETEHYLEIRLPALADSLAGQLAPPLSREEGWWRCGRCDVRRECQAAYGNSLPGLGGINVLNPGRDPRPKPPTPA